MSQKPFNPSWLDDAGLSPAEFRVYLHLCRRANSQTGIAWPSYESIQTTCGMSHKTVWRSLRKLKECRLIVSVGKPFGGSCRYQILTPNSTEEIPSQASPNSVTKGTIETPIMPQGESLEPLQSFPSGNSNRSPEETPIMSPGEREGSPSKGIQLRKSIKEISLEGNQFAQWFKGSLPETTKLQTGWRQSFAQTYDDLIRLDKRNPDEIRRVCQWARTDSFWASNFQSPAKLRTRNKDGILGYDVLLQKMIQASENRKPSSAPVNTYDRKNTNSEDL
jgi:hypothetical protein